MGRISRLKTPLELRATIRRLRTCPHSLHASRQILWPFPWKLQLPAHQAGPADFQADRRLRNQRQSGIEHLREMSLFRLRDTALQSLYRLYEDICAGQLGSLGPEMVEQITRKYLPKK